MQNVKFQQNETQKDTIAQAVGDILNSCKQARQSVKTSLQGPVKNEDNYQKC